MIEILGEDIDEKNSSCTFYNKIFNISTGKIGTEIWKMVRLDGHGYTLYLSVDIESKMKTIVLTTESNPDIIKRIEKDTIDRPELYKLLA